MIKFLGPVFLGGALGALGLFAVDRLLAEGREVSSSRSRSRENGEDLSDPRRSADPSQVQVEHFFYAEENRFPDVELVTHEGRRVRFYRDLIQGKVVALNFMYVTCEGF